MEIECPGCAARYDVPAEAARPGRAMRCARCGETWVPEAVVTAAAESDAPLEEPAAAPDMSPAAGFVEEAWPEADAEADAATARAPLVPQAASGGGAALVAAWIASLVVLAVAVWAAWHFHLRIERAWAPSARLFGLFGRHPH